MLPSAKERLVLPSVCVCVERLNYVVFSNLFNDDQPNFLFLNMLYLLEHIRIVYVTSAVYFQFYTDL